MDKTNPNSLEIQSGKRLAAFFLAGFRLLAPLLALLALVIVTALCERWMQGSSSFLKAENWTNILRRGSFVGIVAIGMTFVIILGGIDLSVGSLVAMAGGVGVWLMNTAINAAHLIAENDAVRKTHAEDLAAGLKLPMELAWSPVREWLARAFTTLHLSGSEASGVTIAIVAIILIGLIGGAVNGLLVARGRLAPFIATLGTMAAYRSVVLALADGGEFRSASANVFKTVGTGGISMGNSGISLPYPAIIFLAVAVVGSILLNRTRYGRYVIAIGCNERAAVYSAVNVSRVKLLTYTLTGGCAGISALLLASRMNSVASSTTGMLFELDAIAAVVIGGTRMRGGAGSVWGTVVGVLILGVIDSMLNFLNVSPYLQGLAKGAIIIAAVLMQRSIGSDR